MKIRGEFDVKMTPLPAEEAAGPMGRFLLDKQYRGDLTGASRGQMVAFRSATDGSAGYVAMEQVTGTLAGRAGTFVLQHSSLMTRGVPTQSITVVPDSGTGELAGLSGSMTIDIVDKKHFYDFMYEIANEGAEGSTGRRQQRQTAEHKGTAQGKTPATGRRQRQNAGRDGRTLEP